MHHVYHLIDPQTRAVRYVGKSRHPRARLALYACATVSCLPRSRG